jgi:hypothetical protein
MEPSQKNKFKNCDGAKHGVVHPQRHVIGRMKSKQLAEKHNTKNSAFGKNTFVVSDICIRYQPHRIPKYR